MAGAGPQRRGRSIFAVSTCGDNVDDGMMTKAEAVYFFMCRCVETMSYGDHNDGRGDTINLVEVYRSVLLLFVIYCICVYIGDIAKN